jgi:hypothetical protein
MSNNELPEDLAVALQDPIAREQLLQYFRILIEWGERRAKETAQGAVKTAMPNDEPRTR